MTNFDHNSQQTDYNRQTTTDRLQQTDYNYRIFLARPDIEAFLLDGLITNQSSHQNTFENDNKKKCQGERTYNRQHTTYIQHTDGHCDY